MRRSRSCPRIQSTAKASRAERCDELGQKYGQGVYAVEAQRVRVAGGRIGGFETEQERRRRVARRLISDLTPAFNIARDDFERLSVHAASPCSLG